MKAYDWVKEHFIGVNISISVVLAIWGILVYEFDFFGLPWSYLKGWDKFVLGISYGLLGGFIVYVLTVRIPLYRRNTIYKKTLFVWLANTYREFSQIPNSIPNDVTKHHRQIFIPGEGITNIISVECIMCILQRAKATDKITILDSNITVIEALRYYLSKIYERAQMILNIYSDILNTKEINCLNTIITSEVYAYLKFIDPSDAGKILADNQSSGINSDTHISTSLPFNLISKVLESLYICFLSLDNIKHDVSIDLNLNE